MAIILSVLLVSACFAAIGATAAQAFEVSASSPESVTPGQSYDLVITLDSMPALGSEEHVSAIIFKVGYDKDLVTFDLKQGKEADFTTTLNSGLENIVAVEDDYIDATFMDFSFGDLFAADQTVTFHFTVNESAVSNVVFDVYDVAYAIGTNMTAFIDGVGTGSVSIVPSEVDYSDLWPEFSVDDFDLVNIDSGTFQTGGIVDDSAYKFQWTYDDEYIYGAMIALYTPIGNIDWNGNGKGTFFRLWFYTNVNSIPYTSFVDFSYIGPDAEPIIGGKFNSSLLINKAVDPVSTDGIVTESKVGNDYWFLQYKIPIANVGAPSVLEFYASLGNGKDDEKGIANDALMYPAIPPGASRSSYFPYSSWGSTAFKIPIEGVSALLSEMDFDYSKLYKLVDGVYAADATTFADERLVNFNWEGDYGYSYEEGAENGTHQFSLLYDLSELKNVAGVKVSAYKDINSFINLPQVKIYLSNDGVNFVNQATGSWASPTEGLVASTDRTEGLVGECTYTANWATRTALTARYVKFVFTLTDPWISLSEVEIIEGSEDNAHPVDEVILAGVNVQITGESVVVLTSDVGELDMGTFVPPSGHTYVPGDFSLVSAGVMTFASWDADKQAYVIYKNEVNPYPNTREGMVTIPDGDILICSVSNGAIPSVGAGDKWVMWHLDVGDELHIYDDVITIGKILEGREQLNFSFIAPDYPPANITTDIGIMAIDEFDFEGITSIHTTGTYNGAYRVAALLELVPMYDIYTFKVIAVTPSSASGPNWEIAENQFVIESNMGNNWPALHENPAPDAWYLGGANIHGTPYAECPNFVNPVNSAWYNLVAGMKVGDYYKLVGIDYDDIKVVSKYTVDTAYSYIYQNDVYETYSYLTPFAAEPVQPATSVELPNDAIVINYAGYKHAAEVSIVAGDNQTIAELTARGNGGVAKDMNYAYNILVGSDNVVIAVDFTLSQACTFVCPEGGYIISYNANKAGYAVMGAIEVGDVITLYNINVPGVAQINSNVALVSAGFTYQAPGTEDPSEPTTEEPTTAEPTTEEPTTEEPTTEEPSEPVSDGYDFMETASSVKINESVTGESVRIFTTNEALLNSNTKWTINVVLALTEGSSYKVVSVATGNGSNFAGTLEEGQILLAVHSSSSNPDDIGTYQNVLGKLAAMALEPDDVVIIEGLDDGEITRIEYRASTPGGESEPEDPPHTGDAGFIILGVIAAIAAAGVVVVKRVK